MYVSQHVYRHINVYIHDISTHLRDLQHLPEFVRVTGDEVEEGQLLEVFGLLVRHLHHLVVALRIHTFIDKLMCISHICINNKTNIRTYINAYTQTVTHIHKIIHTHKHSYTH